MKNKKYMTKKEAVKIFRENILPGLKHKDKVAINTEWGIFTDDLCKSGQISQKQYDNWMPIKK